MLYHSVNDLVWVYPQVDRVWAELILKEFSLPSALAELLAARGFSSLDAIHEHLYAKLPDLHDPYLLPDMAKAVERVLGAWAKKETILICGDNDVDGITATALLTEFFMEIGLKVCFFIPNRHPPEHSEEFSLIGYAKKNRCTLLITVDCGITIAKELHEAERNAIDVIITDHHEPTLTLPRSIAILNPKLPASLYPNQELTGVGVAFKLAHALTNALISSGNLSPSTIDLKSYLDLVALGTLADMGSLLGENRILVRYGLIELRRTKRIGLKKLSNLCCVNLEEVSSSTISSKITPQLNSLGRIADPVKGVELLLLRDPQKAEQLAKELDLNNLKRQRIDREATEESIEHLFLHPHLLKNKALVLSSTKWHPGIIPLISVRISKQYNRPTLIIALEHTVGKGSLRTIPEFPLMPFLREEASLLIDFGGHDYAAGLTIKEENIPLFTERFLQAASQKIQDTHILPKLHLDAKLPLKELDFDFMESLNLLEPFGYENPPPLFYCEAKQTSPPQTVGKGHLKFHLKDKGRLVEGLAFGLAQRFSAEHFLPLSKHTSFPIAFTPQINQFQSNLAIQLHIKDFKTSCQKS